MKRFISIPGACSGALLKGSAIALFIAASCSSMLAKNNKIEISNPSDLPSAGEIVEVDASRLSMKPGEFILLDSKGNEVGYQITHDRKIIFPADVAAKSKALYKITAGTPVAVDTISYGRFVPERLDDLTWENDRAAYRAYGPALQKSGQRAYGYDIWSKSVAHPVIDQRYYDHLHRGISFHEDHGNGLDDYAVGPTLGAGTDALVKSDGSLLMPWSWSTYKILDCGPLRFSVALEYLPTEFEGDTLVETRVITLDKGSFLNKTDISFSGLTKETPLAQGIVVHSSNPEGYALDAEKKYVAVEDLNEHPDRGNGKVYVGIVSPTADNFKLLSLDKPVNDVEGHASAISLFSPGENMTYYWGSGWSKGFMPDFDTWKSYLSDFSYRLAHPLQVKVK